MKTILASEKWFYSDQHFNQLYPPPVQKLANRHWTPLAVCQKAADFLAAEPGARILDIGSGAGKFCLSAAHYRPKGFFTGIEQRAHLVDEARKAQDATGLINVRFICGNFTQLDLRDYDHFYFYNSFYENLAETDKIDDSIDYSIELFNYYNRYLFNQLDAMPDGTKLVTFHSLEAEVPPCYHVVWSATDSLLKCWMKI